MLAAGWVFQSKSKLTLLELYLAPLSYPNTKMF